MKINLWKQSTLLTFLTKGGKLILILGLLLLFLDSKTGFTQVTLGDDIVINYGKPVQYEIAGVTITGVEYLDKNVLVMLAGFNVGEKIMIPGEAVSKAIKKLWEQGLFENIAVIAKEIQGDKIFLELQLKERPRLSHFSLKGVNKTEADNIRDKISITTGDVVTESLLMNTRHLIREYFREKGFLDAQVDIVQQKDTSRMNNVFLEIDIKKNKRVKIYKINPDGNEHFSDQWIKKSFKETKEKGTFTPLEDIEVPIVKGIHELIRLNPQGAVDAVQDYLNKSLKLRIFKSSKFIEDKYEEDLANLIKKYNAEGYRDAAIVKDSLYRNADSTLNIDLKIYEGDRYYFRNITWIGNTKYTADQLNAVLKIQKGDVYNREYLETNLTFNLNGLDVSSLYLDDGYLFFNATPVECSSKMTLLILRSGSGKANKHG